MNPVTSSASRKLSNGFQFAANCHKMVTVLADSFAKSFVQARSAYYLEGLQKRVFYSFCDVISLPSISQREGEKWHKEILSMDLNIFSARA